MFGIGTTEIIIILVLAVVILGAGRMSEVGKGLGRALREFRNVQDDFEQATRIKPSNPPRLQPPQKPEDGGSDEC